MSIISKQDCIASYNSSLRIFDTTFCAQSNARQEGDCQDDSSGGPIIVDGRQVGISIWSKGCMDTKFPGIYSRIAAYKDWIAANGVLVSSSK